MIKWIISLFFIVAGVIQITGACDENHDYVDQELAYRNTQIDPYDPYYYANSPFFIPYFYNYPPSSRINTSPDNYEARTPSGNKFNYVNPFKNAQPSTNDDNFDEAENRFLKKLELGSSLLSSTGLFNNMFSNNAAAALGGGYSQAFKPYLSSKFNKWRPLLAKADLSGLLSKFQSCTAPSLEEGICVPGSACTLFGGRPSGSCGVKDVCCINAVTTCGSTVTLNNTYWQSPTTLPTTCSLSIQLDPALLEQSQDIAQIRLDFNSFSIGQPNANGDCATDVFQVTGADNSVPNICGDNAGQHMYLDVPSAPAGTSMTSPTSRVINLSFQLGAQSSASRMWNIKVSMLPAGSKYLAPQDCLQYYTAPTGRVRSFNWQDVGGSATRQLNNQNYNICFRTELVANQRANQMCLTECAVKNGGDAFLITSPSTATNPAAVAANAKAASDAATLAAAQTALNSTQSTLTTATTNVTTAQNAVTAATPANYAALQAALVTAQTNVKTAQANLLAAQTAVLNAGVNVTPAQAQAIIDAQTALTAAQAAYTAAQNALNLPDLTAAQSALAAAQASFNNAQAAFNAAKSAFTAAQTAYSISSSAAAAANSAASSSSSSGTTYTITTTTTTTTTTTNTTRTGRQSVGAALPAGTTFAVCLYDYLLIDSGTSITNDVTDRYCGNLLNPANGATTSVQVCTPIKPFRITYHTDGTEGAVAAGTNILPALADTANQGFCLDFQER